MPGPCGGYSTQQTTQQKHAKPRHQSSDRDQRAQQRLKDKAFKEKSKMQHILHWDQQHYAQYIKHLTQAFRFYFICHHCKLQQL